LSCPKNAPCGKTVENLVEKGVEKAVENCHFSKLTEKRKRKGEK
jgi:hypothetical protein